MIDARGLSDRLERIEIRKTIAEYWIAEVVRPGLRLFVLKDGRYEEVVARDGLLASTVVPGLVIDPIALHGAALWAAE